jgi:hypothetical protein
MNNYSDYREITLASHTVDGVHAEVLQLDADGEYYCANVYREDADGYITYLNNSGSVSLVEAMQAFAWDLDCFLDGTKFDDFMLTEQYYTRTI